ncbi:MAG: MCE family protein [Deltaproteobacteria bacterium]|nr:MCE family protein [Deltaproteobacteria bacterium]
MEERNLEIKVGIFVLVAAALLTGFIFVMGGISFEDRFEMYVDFNNPLWLSEGATVKVSGVEAGKVEEIAFLGGQLDPKTNRRVYVRVKLLVNEKVRGAFRADAEFYIANQGLLGEQYVEIDPGTFEAPPFDFGKAAQGKDPPRLEKFLIQGYQMINKIDRMLDAPDEDIDGLLVTVVQAMRSLDRGMSGIGNALEGNEQDIKKLLENLRKITDEALLAVHSARKWLDEGGKVDLILSDVRAVTQDLPRQADQLIERLDSTVAHADQLIGQVQGVLADTVGEDQRRQLRAMIANLESVSERAVGVADDVRTMVAEVRGDVEPVFDGVRQVMDSVQQIVRNIQRGEGTVGALLADEQIYDDLKELIRDLKHNPWKFFWRE